MKCKFYLKITDELHELEGQIVGYVAIGNEAHGVIRQSSKEGSLINVPIKQIKIPKEIYSGTIIDKLDEIDDRIWKATGKKY